MPPVFVKLTQGVIRTAESSGFMPAISFRRAPCRLHPPGRLRSRSTALDGLGSARHSTRLQSFTPH